MRERVISAVIALLITVPLLLLGGIYFKVLAGILGILSLKELISIRKNVPNCMIYIAYLLFLVFFLDGIVLVGNEFTFNIQTLILFIFVLIFPIIIYNNKKIYNIDDALFIFGGLMIISLVFSYFVIIRDGSLMTTLYLLLIPILTDTFAYLSGRKIGKNKLIPNISPNKSVEGLVIGTIVGTVCSSVFYYFCVNNTGNIYVLIFVTLFLSLVGQFGDLIFSSIKRNYDIKDFSNIMPGHGGILDRLDSSIFVILGYIVIQILL